ncbi:MAG: transcriptional repressor [Nitrospinae bacterium]|nr:transcriptional repressor [Nitrospinota bacterium]
MGRTTTTDITDLLKGHGITSTLQRVEIAQILLSRPQHLSAEQTLEKVNRGRSLASKATIYNTLKLFVEKGLAREVIADPARVFYEPKTTDHHHIFDVDTGELSDIEPGSLMIAAMPQLPDNMEVLGMDVVIRVKKRDQ